jgi:hypothetical protein
MWAVWIAWIAWTAGVWGGCRGCRLYARFDRPVVCMGERGHALYGDIFLYSSMA